jgi:mono/diheme cytochrome c family protein
MRRAARSALLAPLPAIVHHEKPHAMHLRTVLTVLFAAGLAALLATDAAEAQSGSGGSGAKGDYWCCGPMPRGWRREPMGPMFRSRILRQRTFMQGRYPPFYRGLKNPLPKSPANVATGRALYKGHCETCHGVKGLGAGESARGLTPSPAMLAFLIRLPETADSYLMWTIAEGGLRFGTAMPAFKHRITFDQIWQIVTYMRAGFPG